MPANTVFAGFYIEIALAVVGHILIDVLPARGIHAQ
jgi:hypothetical protein